MDLNPGNWGLYYLLNKYCNLYLDDVKAENVKMALWSGSATIRDFSLKTDHISLKDFPLSVVEASIGLADIQIPWKSWRKRAPEVTLQDIRLVLKTTPTRQTSSDSEGNKETEIERFERDAAGLFAWVESVLRGTNSYSFLTKTMLSTLLHNLKVTLRNVNIVLEHCPKNHSEVHKFTLNVQVDRMSSYSTNGDFEEMPTWDSVCHFRRAEISSLSANSEFSPANQPTFTHKSIVLCPLSLSANVSFWQFDLVEFTTDRGDVDVNIDCSYIALRLSRTLIEVLLELQQRETGGNAVLTPKQRFCRVGNKVKALVRSQLARTSLISVVRKAFWKEMYIQGYMLHLNKGLVPQNQIGFSHGEKDSKTCEESKMGVKTCKKDPRYLSAAFYDLESLLSLSEILSYRREAVERHLMQVTKLEEQVLRTSKSTGTERQGPKQNTDSRRKLLVRAEENPKSTAQGRKQVCVKLRVGISSCAVELITLKRYVERAGVAARMKCKEESCLFFRTEGVECVQTSVVTYSPLLTLHNRFAHEEILTILTLNSLHLWLTAPTPNHYAMRKPVLVSPSSLTIQFKSTRKEDTASKLQYLNRSDLTMHVELEEANVYIYPELLTCLEDYFAFCFSTQNSKYAKEIAFFKGCRPTPLFRARSAINRRVKITCKQLIRVTLMTSFQNHCDAVIFELVYFRLKAEKWPSDTIAVEINSIRAFALSMPRANVDLLEVVRTVPRVLFTAGFSVKLLIASYRSISAGVRDKKVRRKEVHKELRTPDYLLSVISQELLIHLTGDQLKSLISLAEVWTRQSPSSPPLSPYTLKLDLTTKQMRRATHQVQFSLELDCKGAVINIVSNSGPYMKILAHQFEMSYKGKCFESLVLVQCQGLEVLDTRSYIPGVLFAIGEGEKGKWVELIQQKELDESGFLVDRKNVLILTCRSTVPESEQYRNISSEVQLAAQSLHLTYNPRILADTLSLFQPILSPKQAQSEEKPPTDRKEAKVIELKLVLDWGELYLNCIFDDKPLFSFHTRNVISVLDVYAYKTQLRLNSENLRCVDTSRGPVYNKLILGTVDQTAYLAVNYEAKSVPNQAETATLQVRMRNSRLTYLNRVIMDILEYVNRFFIGKSDPNQPLVSPMSMEILFSDCEIELPRNSLSSQWQTISLDQLFLRRNASEGSLFESTSQFEYESQPVVDWDLELSEKQAARTRRTRLNQYQRQRSAQGMELRELFLSVEEVRQLRPVCLKGLSVYYYKPEGLEVGEEASVVRVETGEGSFGRMSPVLQLTAIEPAPDPTDSEAPPSQSKDSLSPAPSSFNWQIQATNLRLFGVGEEEIMYSSSLRVFLFSSACPKLQIQLEDDINFFFTQRSFTFLLQTLLENMGELQTIPPAELLSPSNGTENSPDFSYFQIVLLGNKANFLFSSEKVADENAGAHDLDLAQFIFSDLRIECSLHNSGSKAIHIELDGFTLRDQRLKSLLRYLSMGDENFEPLIVYPNATESDISRANLVIEMQLYPSGLKEINMVLADCQVLLVPDLFTALQGFFTSVFDPSLNPPPSYMQLPEVIPSAGMRFALSLESVNFLFPSSFDSLMSTLLVLHTKQTALTYKTTGDAYNGPGSARVQCLLKITHMYFSNFEEQQMERMNHAMLLLQAEVNLEYLRQKPSTHSSWVGEQVLVHVVDGDGGKGGMEESKWHFNLTISEVWKIMDIFKCLSQSSLSRPSLGPADVVLQEESQFPDLSEDSQKIEDLEVLPLKLSPDIPTRTLQHTRPGEELRNFSLSLAIDKLLITVLNKDIHPLLSFQFVTLGTYQSQGHQSSQCQVEAWLTVHYFNQRTTAWEPALEWCSWDLDLGKYNQHSKLTLSSDISKTLLPTNINISYSLIDLIGGLWKNWTQEIEGTELSSATPYKFYNYTGLPLGISTSSDESGDILELEPNEVREISRKFVGQGKYLRFSSINRYKIDIIVNLRKATTLRKGFFSTSEEFRKVKSVPIDTSDVHVMPLIERWTHYDFSAYKRSATKKVTTLKLKDKIESFFVQADHEREIMEEQGGGQTQSRCCSCLPWGKKADPEVEQEQANIRLLVVEVRWIQEYGLKEILIRSSLTLRNELSTLVEVEMTTLSNAPVVEEVYPGKKLYIPLPVVNFGSIKIRPNKNYDWSREITLSALSGIVKEKELKRLDVEGLSHGTQSLVLGFVPLICKYVGKTDKSDKVEKTLPFSCALETLKKKNNTIRKKVVKDERYVWVPDKRMMNMRRSNSGKGAASDLREEREDPEDDLGEEELIFQERELLLSSIMSITNALPVTCTVEISDEEGKIQKEPSELMEISKDPGEEHKEPKKKPDSILQGQTYHLFFNKFYAKSLILRLKLDGYDLSNPLKIRLGKIKEEKKFTTKLVDHNSNHKLFVKVAVSSDDFGCWRMFIYVPFWILNKTIFELLYAEPELFQAKREAKQTAESEDKGKEGEVPDLFVKSGEEDDFNEEEFKETTKGFTRIGDRRKSRKTLNIVECPFCKCKNQISPFSASDKLCTNCRKPLVSDGSKSPLIKSEQIVTCIHCDKPIPVSPQDYSEGYKHGIECPYCKGIVYPAKKSTLQFASELEETAVKRMALSSPGAIAATQSRKSTSVISASKAANWSKFIVYSPSQMVSKLKVAMIDSEITSGKKTVSKWSDTFSLGNAGTSGFLSFNMQNDMKIDLGVRIDRGKGVFHRTNIITFTPRYMLKCQNLLKLVCRQVGAERYFNITPDDFTTFNWPNRSLRELMTIALFNEYSSNLKWSGGFYIHEQGEFIITVQNDSRKTEDFILVSIVGVGPTQVVQFQQQKKDDSPPFLLRNFTSHQVHYVQNVPGRTDLKTRTIPECRRDGDRVIPSVHYYALDEETERAEVNIMIADVRKQYLLDILGEMEPMDLKSSAEGWTSSTKRKWGLLEQRRRFIGVYKNMYAEVSDGVLIRKKSEQDLSFKSISLLEECVKAVDFQNSVFYLYTCLKRYQFRASSPEDAQAWIQALMEGKEASGSLTSQLIHVDIALEGATHVLSLRTGNSKNQKGRHLPGCKILQEQLENRKKLRSKEIWFEFQFFVSSVNISIIDDGPQEVLLLSLAETQLEYYQYRDHYEGFQITINVIKLDNQMMQNYWPVILAPFARKRKDLKKSVFVSFSKHSGPQLDHIHYLDIYVQPIELRLEGSVLNFLLRAYDKIYGTFVSGETQAKTKHKEKTLKEDVFQFSYTDSFEEVVEMAESQAVPLSELLIPSAQKKLFIEELVIQPFWIVLSVNMNSPIDSPLPRKFLFSLASIGLAITSIEAAEINMEGLRMIAMYQLRSRFAERLVQHYYSKCVFQVYKILGAMEFLGNPANLLQSFKAGMKAALVKPVYALMRDPRDFIPELLKGGFGMVTHTIHGVFTSASKLAGGIGRSLALLTMDQQFQRARRNLLNRKVSSIADGLMVGLKHAGYGLFDGVTSIVTSPMQGYKQGGVEGLFAGIGKGIVGTVVKPVSGLFDAFSATTSSLGKYARATFEIRFLERTRIPRHFHKDRILYPYDAALAQAQFLLYRYNPVYRHEYVIFFAPLIKSKKKYVLIITKSHIFYMREKSSSDKGKKFNKETIQDIKLQDYAKSLHILFKDGKKLLIDCNSIEDKDQGREGSKWKELSEICLKFGREARMRVVEEEGSDQV